jgi:uncharacterized protein (TIGR03437 family)
VLSLKRFFRSLPVVLAALTAAGVGELRAQAQFVISPSSLAFNFTPGGSSPGPQFLSIAIGSGSVAYSATVTTSTGGQWLGINPANGLTTTVAQVSVSPFLLPDGTYSGNIRITAAGVTNSPQDIPVTLTVGTGGGGGVTNSQLIANPSALSFTAQVGTAAPAAANVTITSSTGSAVPYTISTTTTSGGTTWLGAVASGGSTTPGNVSVSVNHAGLAGGIYNGSVVLTPTTGGGTAQVVPVTLNVTATTSLTASSTGLTFNFQTGRATPGNQTINIASTQGSLTYTAVASTTGGSWVTVTPNIPTLTPSALTVAVNPTSTPPGTYHNTITVTAPGSSNILTIPVDLVVSSTALLNVNPTSVTFNYGGGITPTPIPISVTSTGDTLVYSITTSPGAYWLKTSAASGITTPNGSTFNISIDPMLLPVGTAQANVILTSIGVPSVIIPVTVTGATGSAILVSPSQMNFSAALGGNSPPFQSFSVVSNDSSNQAFTVNSTSTNNFLFVQQNQFSTGSFGATVNVGINLVAITAPGTYTGTISVTPLSGSLAPAFVTVTLTVTGNTTVTATPASLAFTPAAGTTTPQTQTIQLSSSVTGVSFLVSSSTISGNWLSVVSNNNNTALPATLTVTANPTGLAPGKYDGTITVVTSGAQQPLTIPVTLTIANAATIAVAPASLTFSATAGAGSAAPAAQTFQVTGSAANTTFSATAATNSGGSWLDVTPKSGTAPATLTVTVNQTGLAAGQYTGTISVTGNGTSNSPQTVTIVLNVAAPVLPLITSVVNAATFSPTAIAPGEIVTIFGTNMGLSAITGLKLNSSGLVDTTLAETQVLFDGIPAPLVYVSANQISAIVPYNVFARLSTRVQVVYQGQTSTALEMRVVDTAPGIFTLNSQGTGNAAALNQNGTVNGPSNPALQGQAVVLYLTGEGQTDPQGVNGQVSSGSNLKRPRALVSAKIAGIPVIVDYAGCAPGLVSGVMQLNLRVPLGLPAGPAIVEVTIGTAVVSNATISVQ